MATAPVKAQPLHNFPLSLKWGQTQPTHTTTESETESDHDPPTRRLGSRSSRNRRDHTIFNFASCSTLLSVNPKSRPEDDEGNSKRWKLRPRKGNGGGGEGKEEAKSVRLRESNGGSSSGPAVGGERKENRKIWISLGREEIEEDIFIMTGSRPARRPTKRPKNVQKLLDAVFPGLWLVGATVDSYKMAEAPVKR